MNRYFYLWLRKSTSLFACVCLCSVLTACVNSDKSHSAGTLKSTPREILVMHPGMNPTEAVERTLFQTRDEQGNIVFCYMDVPSVICVDGQCEIITVRLVWGPLGNYIRYELPEGRDLTRQGHERFTDADYRKLQTILLDTESILKSVDPKDVVSPADALSAADVDGVSGATVLSDKTAIVSGAVYTCYTLWHWVNSDVQEAIRALSRVEMSNAQLTGYLNSGTEEQRIFAIEQCAARRIHDETTAATILEQMRSGSRNLVGPGLEYFKSMGVESYYGAVEKLFYDSGSEKRILYLSSLTSTDLKAPAGFYGRLSTQLPEMESYQEVHLLLSLLTCRNLSSTVIVSNTMPLLDDPSFLVARKAYYFLLDQELAPEQTAKLELFRRKNADRL